MAAWPRKTIRAAGKCMFKSFAVDIYFHAFIFKAKSWFNAFCLSVEAIPAGVAAMPTAATIPTSSGTDANGAGTRSECATLSVGRHGVSQLKNKTTIKMGWTSCCTTPPDMPQVSRRHSSDMFEASCSNFTVPTSNGGMQKWKLGWNMYTLHTNFCVFGDDLYAQSVLTDKISASEPSRKFIKGALLVGLPFVCKKK